MDKIVAQFSRKKKLNMRETVRNYFSLIGLLIVAVVFEILTEGNLLQPRNLMNIFNNFFSIGLGAMGVVFLMSLGELDLSVGAIAGLSAALAAYAAQISLVLILPVAILTGIAIGLLNGVMIARLRVESFIGTLAMSFVARGITTWLLNGSVGIPISLRVFDQNSVKIFVFVALLAVLFLLFEFSPYGKQCRSVGASVDAARQSGVKVEKVRTMAFMISGLMCGLVGFFSLVRTCTASSKTGNAFEFDVLLAVLFGGMPLTGGWPVKFRAAILGSIAMSVMKNGMSLMGIDGLTQQIVEGVILIAIVVIAFDRKSANVIK
ncbi:ABC transporter permease [Caproicibacter fermentans]|uniref:Autoinducer 2 import system permease protein LsrD n=1 Tax=Caproicibacter fermentans TaxID=2576756 RepID=A0A7G8TDU1_9FIRM|nr:ABC transporter permease [Caproicibacter fermentans]QNK41782.1 ABC transporter permease [Caproicibacter fermentans]